MTLKVDINDILKQITKKTEEVINDVKKNFDGLTILTHQKTLELAKKTLKSEYDRYEKALKINRVEDNMWEIELDASAVDLEKGRDQKVFMEWLLEGKSAKTNKKGERYAVIPFKHNKSSSSSSKTQKNITNQIKSYMKSNDMKYDKIELDKDGSPRLGLIHKFDVKSGLISRLLYGPNKKLKDNHTSAPTQGVRVYQNKMPDGSIRKDIMTFRVINEKHQAEGKWFAPTKKANNFMDQAFEWAAREWENKILPELQNKYK
jgi:hypothetical protein